MQKLQSAFFWAFIASETSHIFCCVLPTVFSVVSLLTGLGLISAMPAGWAELHRALHHYEIPLIALSGIVLALGWALYVYSRKIDCHDTGCHHGPCAPKKKINSRILKIATVLFVINLSVYGIFHRGMDIATSPHEMHEGNNH